MLKITGKTLNLNVSFPIEIGELKLTAHVNLWVYKNSDGTNSIESDLADVEDISYMGITINGFDNWGKFKKFHLEMGIDFEKAINKKFREIITEEAINELIKDIKL